MERKKVLITSILSFLVIFIYIFGSKVEVRDVPKNIRVNKVQSNKQYVEGMDNEKNAKNIELNKDNKENSNKDGNIANSSSNDDSETSVAKYRDGTHKGSGKGFKGDIEVEVQVENGKIVGINIINSNDDEAYFDNAKNVIDKIIEVQDLNVDVVGGATYSSNGIIEAVKSALK